MIMIVEERSPFQVQLVLSLHSSTYIVIKNKWTALLVMLSLD
jgi:hypothetical protein